MTNATGLTLPISPLTPIVNNKQQLVALSVHFDNAVLANSLQLLHHFKSSDFFDELSSLSLLLPIDDVIALPADIDARIAASKIILCIPEASCNSPDAQTKLNYLVSKGVQIVVDDFASQTTLVWDGSSTVCVDCTAGVPMSIKPWLASLSKGLHIAKNVNTAAQLQAASDIGFSSFCGDYAFNPAPNNKSGDATARTRLLKLLGLVSRDAESRELEELFKQDTTLSFMLFKMVSSAAFAQTVKVSSFGQAINLLGRRQLQRWLQLLLYARPSDNSGALNPLMLRAAFRASLMEVICQKNGGNRDQQDSAFMVGMFSLLDTLFGSPLAEILLPLNLIDDVLAALLNHDGVMGAQLQLVTQADRITANLDAATLQKIGLDAETYYDSLTKAYVWVNQVCQDM